MGIMQIGSLVNSQVNKYGVGKIEKISDTQVTVEYFYSVNQRISEVLKLPNLVPVKLQRQTRCYIYDEIQERWIIGRISAWDEELEEYEVHLPDKKVIFVGEEEIYVRCNLPPANPMENLAIKCHETPYFHEKRIKFMKSLISQRAVCRGMTGLISANVTLYPHQVEVVRRVLEDPIQRYLLADEVGLGKTIEAGVILRQFLLDEDKGGAVVIVPPYLLGQWQEELKQKFYVGEFPKRVAVITIDDIQKINPNVKLGLVIIDEAHHVASLATSLDNNQRQKFQQCKQIAHASDRLLLLSATPVLHHEQDFLTMLHLLDPQTYKISDLESFRVRVQNRQQIGRILLAFRESADDFVIKSNLKQLKDLFAEDKYLQKLVDELETCLQEKSAKKEDIIRGIRTHISETYRLHRRMLRNRRDVVEDVVFERDILPKEEYDLDERSLDIHELILQWRELAPKKVEYQKIFTLLFLAAGTWLGILEQVINARINGQKSTTLIQEFREKDIKILTETPKFPEELEILQSLVKAIKQPADDGERIRHLLSLILNQLGNHCKLPASVLKNQRELLTRIQQRIRRPIDGSFPKIVIFTSFTQSCKQIVKALNISLGENVVVSLQSDQNKQQIEENLSKFRTNPNCFILVCDRTGEEGHNLQFTDWLIHFDIPLYPNRLEQRIGRVDRIGGKIKYQSFAFLGIFSPDSPHNAWFELIKTGLGIFQQSIASLQFYIDGKISTWEKLLFEKGAAGILEIIAPIQTEIQEEIIKINEQYALDEIDALDENSTAYFEELDDYDANHKQIQAAAEDWICDTLNFRRSGDVNREGVFSYLPAKNTIVSVDEIQTHFQKSINNFGTFNRRIANQNTDIKIYRIGEKLIDSFASYIRWDDRGKSFAFWRYVPDWSQIENKQWFGFQFNYIIETDLSKCTQNRAKLPAIRRLTDGLFAPSLKTIFIDASCQPMSIVEDGELLAILQTPFKDRNSPYKDYNLAKDRLPILDEFIDSHQWADFCQRASETALNLLHENVDFQKSTALSVKIAEQKLGKRLEQLRLRVQKNQQNSEELITEEELNQAIIEGIKKPHIRLDSVGFIVVAGRSLTLKSGED
jgi:ATP-dependent helicase HepA